MSSRSPNTSRRSMEKSFRIDLAGERITQQIYKGQLAVLANYETALEICQSLQSEFEVSTSECESSVNEWLKFALEKKVIELI